MKATSGHWTLDRQQEIALDLLLEKDTLAGLAHSHHVSIQELLAWKEALLQGLRHGRRRSAA